MKKVLYGCYIFFGCLSAMNNENCIKKIVQLHPSLDTNQIMQNLCVDLGKDKRARVPLSTIMHILTPYNKYMKDYGFHLANTNESRELVESIDIKYSNNCYEASWSCPEVSDAIQHSTHFPSYWTYGELIACISKMYENRKNLFSKKVNEYRRMFSGTYVDSQKKEINVVMVMEDDNRVITIYPKQMTAKAPSF
jgi:hypothetical protein